jgi:hypothetical protein
MTAQAQYLLTPGPGGAVPPTGGELQIGTGLPLPIGPAGIFLGGMVPGTAGPTFWPPLLVPPVSNITAGGLTRTIMGTGGGGITVPPAVLSIPAPGVPAPIAVFPTNPAVMQVATTISYAWPAASAVFSSGGAPGPAVLGTGGGGIIAYSGGAKSFGGPAQFAVAAGPGAAGGRVPPNGLGALPVASVWINFLGALPTSVMTLGIVGASAPLGLAQPGAPVAAPAGTTMFGPVLTAGAMTMPNGIGIVNVPVGGGGCTMFCVGPAGTVPSSFAPGAAFPSNMVTASKGFPWSTGFITISQPGAGPPEIFFLSGTDMRVGGVGNLSMVSGALSLRALSGPNANRGWISLNLPEPTVALGGMGALAMLAFCHGLVRRRSR